MEKVKWQLGEEMASNNLVTSPNFRKPGQVGYWAAVFLLEQAEIILNLKSLLAEGTDLLSEIYNTI